jgi:hypothetical protein
MLQLNRRITTATCTEARPVYGQVPSFTFYENAKHTITPLLRARRIEWTWIGRAEGCENGFASPWLPMSK